MEYTRFHGTSSGTSGIEALQSVQFVTVRGKRLAVLSSEDWEALVEWLESIEDAQTVQSAVRELKAAQGDRRRAGWLEWAEASKSVA